MKTLMLTKYSYMRGLRRIAVAGGVLIAVLTMIGLRNEKFSIPYVDQKSADGFAVVELFTSEGCSSCPPADALIAEILKEDTTGLIYILAFHVDYWNHQGWKDEFSDPEFSKRQEEYTHWLDLSAMYTPQIVVNGESEYVGSNRRAVVSAIANGLNTKTTRPLKLNVKFNGNKMNVNIPEIVPNKEEQILLAIIQKSARHNIKAGENSGRMLSHSQIVRKMNRYTTETKEERVLELPKDFQESGWELIGFVQNTRTGKISSAGRTDLFQQ